MNIETTLDEMHQSNDWREAISVAHGDVRAVYSEHVSMAPFCLDDVAEVLASSEGENEGISWLALFALRDGRLAYVSAWCDYTGWG